MYQPNRPQRPDPNELPPGYQPRVIVKFRDDVTPPPLDTRPRVAMATRPSAPERESTRPSWEAVIDRVPGSSVAPLYPSVSREQLNQLVSRARRAAPRNARVPNLANFFAVRLPRGINPNQVLDTVSRWTGVESAYVEGLPCPPPAIDASDDPRATLQGYLNAAPQGIDARFAWTIPGGDGRGMQMIDMERGWTLDHEDLVGARVSLLSGRNKDFFGHGTCVLGEVLAQDNRVGIVGITPSVRGRVVSQWRTDTTYDTSDAIINAIVNLRAGDVLLLEAQTSVWLPATSQWSTFLPVEAELATWAAIWVGSLFGIVIIEAGANGSNDLDAFRHPTDGFILRRGHAQFRESGAILVGAASDTAPHSRLGFSNYGSRIDCYAWGQNIMTTGDGGSGTARNTYSNFSGTSGASPIVTGAALALQGMVKSATGNPWLPDRVRRELTNPRNGTASANPAGDRIGIMPDLRKLHANCVASLSRPAPRPSRPNRPIGDFPEPRGDTRVAAFLDPGHGGGADVGRSSAYGGCGASGALEKDLNLQIATRAASRLGGCARLSRSGDYNLSLGQRLRAARDSGADAVVSIHANTGRRDRSGPEVWVYGDPTLPANAPSRELAAYIRQELESVCASEVPVQVGRMSILDPRHHKYGVAACLVEADSLEHPEGEARLSAYGATDVLGDAVARGVETYLRQRTPPADVAGSPELARAMTFGAVEHSTRHHEEYGSVYGRAAKTIEPSLDEDPRLAQSCQHEETEPEQADLPESYVMALDEPPAELRELLTYLGVSYSTFAAHETRYFTTLCDHLRRHGTIGASDTLSRSSFRDAVRRFQASARLGSSDGIPGENVLWELQKTWAEGRNLAVVRVTADKVPGSGGYESFRIRADIVDRYNAFRRDILAQGGVITSAGSFRDLGATVSAGRSEVSMHYSGLALDLATDTGMQNPARDRYIVTQDGSKWRVYCRSESAPEQAFDAVVWRAGRTSTQAVRARAFDFTAIAQRHGFARIGPRSTFPENYLSAEWWHFQCEAVLVPYISQFGTELLSLSGRTYTEAGLSAHAGIWTNRKRIFQRGGRGRGWW